MRTVIVVLLALLFQVWCSPSSPGCEQVDIDEDEVRGTCCLTVKEGVIDRQKAVQRFLSQKNSPANKVNSPPRMIYPDEEFRQRKPTGNKVNTWRNKPPISEVVTQKSVQTEENSTKNITLGSRVNVDVPDTCTKGYKKDANGKCVEIFD